MIVANEPAETSIEPTIQQIAPKAAIWSALPTLSVEPAAMERQRLVSFQRRHPAALAFDIMRTKLLKDARSQHWTSIGITSPTAGCGKATVAANLAVSLTRHDKVRVVIVDLDLRRPRIAALFGHSGRYTMTDFLRRDCLIEDLVVRIGMNLAIGASPDINNNPAELLHAQNTAVTLAHLRETLRADIVIYNLPSLLESDDCLGLLPLVDTTLLVVGAEHSTINEIDVSERQLQTQTKLLGVVLNKCRYKSGAAANFEV